MSQPRILFCNCTYAQVVPANVKAAVLRKLCESGAAFDAVADLCELSARQDSSLKTLANGAPSKIAACFPRAVKWLFASAGAPLSPEATEVLNMRTQATEEVVDALLHRELKPNLPRGTTSIPAAPTAQTVERARPTASS